MTDLDWFLRLDAITGDSQHEGHRGEVEVESFAWGVTVDQATGGAGGGAGRPRADALTFTTATGRSSPQLFLHAVTGRHLRSATLTGVRRGEQSHRDIELALSDVQILSWHIGADGGGTRDSAGLTFGRVTYTVFPQRPDGSADTPVVAEWESVGRSVE